MFLKNLKARVGFEPVISDFLSRQLYPLHQGPHEMTGYCESDNDILTNISQIIEYTERGEGVR